MRILGICLMVWTVFDVLSSAVLFVSAANEMSWPRFLNEMRKRKKEVFAEIIPSLLGDILTIYYIAATLGVARWL